MKKLIKLWKAWIAEKKAKRAEHKAAFEKSMKRFDTPKHVRDDVEQGDKIKLVYKDVEHTFMYLYSHLDEDWMLRLNDNVIIVWPSNQVNWNHGVNTEI